MIVSELPRSEASSESACAPPAPVETATAPQVSIDLPAPLLRGIGAIVRYRTAQRYAALYPAAMRTVAVNDGSHVTTAPHVSLHKALQTVLGSQHAWVVFDTATNDVRLLDVPAAQAILCRQAAPAESAAAHADVT
jgi:hypothetical protein